MGTERDIQAVRSKFSIGGPPTPSQPLTGRPAALEGRAASAARGLCLKICSVRLKPQSGVAEGQD